MIAGPDTIARTFGLISRPKPMAPKAAIRPILQLALRGRLFSLGVASSLIYALVFVDLPPDSRLYRALYSYTLWVARNTRNRLGQGALRILKAFERGG